MAKSPLLSPLALVTIARCFYGGSSSDSISAGSFNIVNVCCVSVPAMAIWLPPAGLTVRRKGPQGMLGTCEMALGDR